MGPDLDFIAEGLWEVFFTYSEGQDLYKRADPYKPFYRAISLLVSRDERIQGLANLNRYLTLDEAAAVLVRCHSYFQAKLEVPSNRETFESLYQFHLDNQDETP